MDDNFLPNDCKSKILSYLSLYDILSYSCSSKVSLQSTVSDLYRRTITLTKTIIWDGVNERRDDVTSFFEVHQVSNDAKLKHDETIMELPSVYDRIQSLYSILSLNHTMRESVQELLSLISKERNDSDTMIYLSDGDGHNIKTSDEIDFRDTFTKFQQLLQVYKLHAKILKSAINGDFLNHIGQCNGRYLFRDNGDQVHFDLDQYLGDVYIAFIFMGNISSGLVEGVSEVKWLKAISAMATKHATESNETPTLETNACYQYWIFLHSSLMRSIKLSNTEMNEFGLLPTGIMKQSFFNNYDYHDEIFTPPGIFQGEFKTRTVLKIYKSLANHDCLMRVLFRGFGPLGPSFRGRLV